MVMVMVMVMVMMMPMRMADLRAGDRVLALDIPTGRLYVDYVSFNLHVKDTSSEHTGVTLHHAQGQLSVTLHHVVIISGRPLAAHGAKPGDLLQIIELVDKGRLKNVKSAPITRISRWQGGIINTLTGSGYVLAGSAHANISESGSAVQAFAAATTVIDSPHHVQLLLTEMPTLLKLASAWYPRRFQQSDAIEATILLACSVSAALEEAVQTYGFAASSTIGGVLEGLAWAISLVFFLLTDLIVGTSFLVYHTFRTSIVVSASWIL